MPVWSSASLLYTSNNSNRMALDASVLWLLLMSSAFSNSLCACNVVIVFSKCQYFDCYAVVALLLG